MPRAPIPFAGEGCVASGLAWGSFLACSWAWCLGLFLPVLLRRDVGPHAVWLFLVPNVIGAAAMGIVLRPAGASARLIASHSRACATFSACTRAFQCFFLAWMLVSLRSWPAALAVLAAAVLGWRLGSHVYDQPRAPMRTAPAVWLLSLILLSGAMILASGNAHASDVPAPVASRTDPLTLPGLGAACAFGFILCPYLDLTLHHARLSEPARTGTGAFLVGFGVLFPALILLMNAQADRFLEQPGFFAGESVQSAAGTLLLASLALQVAYTASLHAVAVDSGVVRMQTAPSPWSAGAGFITGGLAGVLPVIDPAWAGRLSDMLSAPHTLTAGEMVYRAFLWLYALVFPAYVWVCVLPPMRLAERVRAAKPDAWRRRMVAWLAAVALASPLYARAFFGKPEHAGGSMLAGLGIVLAARIAGLNWRRRRG